MKVAVYGTLRAGYGNHSLLGDSKFIGAGVTAEQFCMLAAGFPVCLDDPGDFSGLSKTNITVEVYEVTSDAVLRRLDALEGHPDWYQRRPVPVRLEGHDTLIEAWMYIMPGDRSDFPSWTHVPSGDYSQYREPRGCT